MICALPDCALEEPCEHGYRTDANGCQTCSCKPNPLFVSCEAVSCLTDCHYGYIEDENGCQVSRAVRRSAASQTATTAT